MSHKQGFRVELAPTEEQAILMGRHCGLSRVVENFCLETVQKKKAQQEAEKTYGITGEDLTKVPWSAPALEREWRAAHPERYPWFADGKLSSRVPKEACRVRAVGIKNFFDSKTGNRKGAKLGWPKWRKRKHGSRFRYDADRAKPLGAHAVRLPAIGDVATWRPVRTCPGSPTAWPPATPAYSARPSASRPDAGGSPSRSRWTATTSTSATRSTTTHPRVASTSA
ncbi:helix-turn-helix domain-containing protein [Streptosporangium sp. NPDC048047]|uniref:helix-turn-helix domain-containing protein n=1 Tax=Streptosporangium sp. NPDC048047 TaxID=3155748 RepID=UPI00342A7B96